MTGTAARSSPESLASLADLAHQGPDALREARRRFCERWLAEVLQRIGIQAPPALREWAMDEAESITAGVPMLPLAEVERELEQLSMDLTERLRERAPAEMKTLREPR
jgi:hypothetical protein